MYARLALVFVALLLAFAGWLLPDKIPLWITVSIVALLIIGAIVQFVLIIRQRKDARKAAYTGRLRREAGDIIISADDHIYPKLEFGDSGAILIFAGESGQPIFKFFRDSHLIVERDGNRMLVSTSLFDSSGTIVARLDRNEWQVNANSSFDRNYLEHALEVMDGQGDIALQVRLVEDRIQLQGKFYGPGGAGIGFGVGTDAAGNRGGAIEMTSANNPRLKMKIEPIFKYPSDLHFGELIAP